MKAVCWNGINTVGEDDVPDPKLINPRDAIIQVTSTAICGSDLHLYDGYVPSMMKGDILGHEFMGEVVEVGSGVKNLKVGDRVVVPFPGSAEEVARTSVNVGASIPQLMLGAAIMGQLAIATIILSRVLKYGLNRWVNIAVSIITIAYIWGGMASYPHYIFIASVETICLLLIMWFAWKWRNVEA